MYVVGIPGKKLGVEVLIGIESEERPNQTIINVNL